MPEPKTILGGVASRINNLHKLEYESGRLNHPAPLRTHRTLTNDHPAQKPKGDRPVRLYETPRLRPFQTTKRADDASRHRFDLPDLRHYERRRQNPFSRRDSSGSEMLITPPRRPESVSRKAFERVRSMSRSPPLAMPVFQTESRQQHETNEQYITRKLTQRWSPSMHSRPASQSPRSREKAANLHVAAPLAQELLNHIDSILMEHTGTLKSVIEDSKRMLHLREVQCREESIDHSVPDIPANKEGLDETKTTNSSVSDLVSAIDRTASYLGLSLPEKHRLHPERSNSARKNVSREVSPSSSSEAREAREARVLETFSTSKTVSPHTLLPPQAYAAFQNSCDEAQSFLTARQRSPHHRFDNTARVSYAFPTLPPCSYNNHQHHPKQNGTSRGMIPGPAHPTPNRNTMTPSPALIEYDRFAALAERASRNSITDPMTKTSLKAGRRASMRHGGKVPTIELSEHEDPSQDRPYDSAESKAQVDSTQRERYEFNLREHEIPQLRLTSSDYALEVCKDKHQTELNRLRRVGSYQARSAKRVRRAASDDALGSSGRLLGTVVQSQLAKYEQAAERAQASKT